MTTISLLRPTLLFGVIFFNLAAFEESFDIAWSPDGSRLYYLDDGETTLKVYDLEKRSATILLKDLSLIWTGIGLSPDGEWIAVPQLAPTPQGTELTLSFHNTRDGRELRRLPPIPVGKMDLDADGGQRAEAAIYWTADGKQMLVQLGSSLLENPVTLFVDPRDGSHHIFRSAAPMLHRWSLRPDGAGALLEQDGVGTVFARIDGTLKPIEGEPDLPDSFFPYSSRWEGHLYKEGGAEGSTVIDTEKLTYTFVPRQAPDGPANELLTDPLKNAQRYELVEFGESGSSIETLAIYPKGIPSGLELDDFENLPVFTIRVWRPVKAPPVVIAEQVEGYGSYSLSPDGKRVAVKITRADWRYQILVFNHEAEVVRRLWINTTAPATQPATQPATRPASQPARP